VALLEALLHWHSLLRVAGRCAAACKGMADKDLLEAALLSSKEYSHAMLLVWAVDFLGMKQLMIYEEMRDKNLHVSMDVVKDARSRFKSPESTEHLIFISHRECCLPCHLHPWDPPCCCLCSSRMLASRHLHCILPAQSQLLHPLPALLPVRTCCRVAELHSSRP
jgi:hypothetical protein